jgi:transposase-like protein
LTRFKKNVNVKQDNNMTKNRSIYSEEFKWKVVQQVLSGTLTKEQARKAYSIKSNSAILYWMRIFSGVTDYRSPDVVSEQSNKVTKTTNQCKLEQELVRLKQELKAEKMRADLWQTMVEVAEEELGVDIRKKFGARQSPDADSSKGKPSA